MTVGDWYTVLICFDGDNQAGSKLYINGSSNSTTSGFTSANNIQYSTMDSITMMAENTNNRGDGNISSIYFTTDYIDFSLESERNKFVNQLNFPRQLDGLIADGTIPNPLIYMKFEDPSNLGLNSGTGGDFSIVGSVTSGSDFTI